MGVADTVGHSNPGTLGEGLLMPAPGERGEGREVREKLCQALGSHDGLGALGSQGRLGTLGSHNRLGALGSHNGLGALGSQGGLGALGSHGGLGHWSGEACSWLCAVITRVPQISPYSGSQLGGWSLNRAVEPAQQSLMRGREVSAYGGKAGVGESGSRYPDW